MMVSVVVDVLITVALMVVSNMVVTVTHVIMDTMGLNVINVVMDALAQIVIKTVSAKMDAKLVSMEIDVTLLVLHSVGGIHVAKTKVNVVHVMMGIMIINV